MQVCPNPYLQSYAVAIYVHNTFATGSSLWRLYEPQTRCKSAQYGYSGCGSHPSHTTVTNTDTVQLQLRVISRWLAAIYRPIPAIRLEALLADVWYGGSGPIEAAAKYGTPDAGWPIAVDTCISLCGHVVPVQNNRVSLRVIVAEIKG